MRLIQTAKPDANDRMNRFAGSAGRLCFDGSGAFRDWAFHTECGATVA